MLIHEADLWAVGCRESRLDNISWVLKTQTSPLESLES